MEPGATRVPSGRNPRRRADAAHRCRRRRPRGRRWVCFDLAEDWPHRRAETLDRRKRDPRADRRSFRPRTGRPTDSRPADGALRRDGRFGVDASGVRTPHPQQSRRAHGDLAVQDAMGKDRQGLIRRLDLRDRQFPCRQGDTVEKPQCGRRASQRHRPAG